MKVEAGSGAVLPQAKEHLGPPDPAGAGRVPLEPLDGARPRLGFRLLTFRAVRQYASVLSSLVCGTSFQWPWGTSAPSDGPQTPQTFKRQVQKQAESSPSQCSLVLSSFSSKDWSCPRGPPTCPHSIAWAPTWRGSHMEGRPQPTHSSLTCCEVSLQLRFECEWIC